MGGIDRLLDALFARLGWRILVAYQAAGWGAGLALGLPAAAYFAWLVEFERAATVRLLVGTLVVWALAATAGSVAIARYARPIVDCCREEDADVERAWRHALLFPQVSLVRNLVAGLVVVPLGMCLVVALAGGGDPGAYVATALGCAGALVAGGISGVFAGQLLVRPLIRDLAPRVPEGAPLPEGISVRAKLGLLLPTLLVVVGIATPVLTLRPGDDLGDFARLIPVFVVVVAVFVGPMAFLLAFSTLQPQEDLLAATRRIRQGDHRTPVPELSADEFGQLARAMNGVMDGLAERRALSLDNERLLDEVRASRVRIVAESDNERKRIERNLHDGAQQRLVAILLRLRLLEEHPSADAAIRSEIDGTIQDLNGAIEELRELAHGLHPSVLATDGLRPALQHLAQRSPLPVRVTCSDDRHPEMMESTAYFVASEAMANVVKYARAAEATIVVEVTEGHLVVEVRDDGIGGAFFSEGSGLSGLADRVAAVGGDFHLDSPVGEGTLVRAHLPRTVLVDRPDVLDALGRARAGSVPAPSRGAGAST